MNDVKARGSFSMHIQCNHKEKIPEKQADEEFFVRAGIIQLLQVRGYRFTLSEPGFEPIHTGRENDDWIPITQRYPTADDADPWGSVLIWDELNGEKIIHWNNLRELRREPVTHWAHMPARPCKPSRCQKTRKAGDGT